ncbi:MAG: protein translocase subunit SecF [Gammaproteobacteria bacterium]|nr:protein translocase subunit SecF [Gammaproteobacteria bacterium]
MQLLDGKLHIDFMSKRKIALATSLLLIILSIASLAKNGLNLGVDFTGGYLIEVGYPNDADIESIRNALANNNFKDAQVQNFGTSKDVLIRIAPSSDINKASISDKVLETLKNNTDQSLEMRRVEYVGPQVGEELRDQGGMAMLVALFFILVYVSLRFQFKSAVGAILALIHDVIITIGCFSILQLDFDLSVLAAILAIIGYSLNDTVVVLDRIRETFRNVRRTNPGEIINLSINQTLSRTLMTSFTTLIVLLALFFLGGEVIHGFASALIIGVIVGTYSSVYVASSTLMAMNITKQDFLAHTKEKEEVVDDMP